MSIEEHSRSRQIELGRSISSRKKVYLDARFWILLRDAALGTSEVPATNRLLNSLREGVANGRLICPISASIFLELLKQPYSPGRRIGTAEVIDELSLGVSLIPTRDLLGTEIYSFLYKSLGSDKIYPMQDLIWTKVSYVLGDTYAKIERASPNDEFAIQKAFFDHLWNISLSDMVATIGNDATKQNRFADLSQYTNEKNAQHKDELRSFAQTYDIELRGSIETAGEVAADVIEHMHSRQSEHAQEPTSKERAHTINWCRNLLYESFKKPTTRDALRCIHIGASIHAAMRWDKLRKFKPNDYFDFDHAISALSYCDAFLTEGPLHTLVTRPQTNLEALNDCKVISDIEAAADFIEHLA